MSDTFYNPLDIAELPSTPSNPPSGFRRLYSKTDGFLYQKTSAGVETQLDNVAASGGGYTVINVNTPAFTVTQTSGTYVYLVDATTSSIVLTLPMASTSTAVYIIKKINTNSNTVTITPTTSNIEGATNALIRVSGASVTVVSNGTNYFIT